MPGYAREQCVLNAIDTRASLQSFAMDVGARISCMTFDSVCKQDAAGAVRRPRDMARLNFRFWCRQTYDDYFLLTKLQNSF